MKSILFATLIFCALNTNAQTTVSASTGSKVRQDEAQTALNFHNKVRKDVGVGALVWSEKLAAFAQEWADHLASKKCSFEHRPEDGKWKQEYGENIFWGSDTSLNSLKASESWYSEKSQYTYGPVTEDSWKTTGHYTQMVWRNTTQIGIGKAVCKGGKVIIVANYDPRGNYIGEKPY